MYKRGVPFVTYSNSVNVINAASGSYGQGTSVGITIIGSGVLVCESTASNGIRVSLNENLKQYTLIAFK